MPWLFVRLEGGWTGRQEDQRPAVFTPRAPQHGTAALSSASSSSLYLPSPFSFLFFCMTLIPFFFQYCVFLLCVQVGLLFWNLALTVLLSSLDLISTLAAKLPTVSFLQLIHLKTNVFFSILCNNVIFLFETKVRAYLISCVCICKGIFILLFYFCRVLNFVYETFPQAASLKCACVCASLHQVEMDPG